MPEISNYTFELRELAEILVKSAGISDGHWMLSVNITFAVGNFQTTPESALPGSIVSFQNVGLTKVDPANSPPNLTVDASLVNPKSKSRT